MSGQVKMRLISQLIKDISRVFQNLFTYFNGTIFSTFFGPASAVLPIFLDLSQTLLAAEKLTMRYYHLEMVHLYSIAINCLIFSIIIALFYYIIHGYNYINTCSILCLCIVDFTHGTSKWKTNFKNYFFIINIWICWWWRCWCDCYSLIYRYICIAIIT